MKVKLGNAWLFGSGLFSAFVETELMFVDAFRPFPNFLDRKPGSPDLLGNGIQRFGGGYGLGLGEAMGG